MLDRAEKAAFWAAWQAIEQTDMPAAYGDLVAAFRALLAGNAGHENATVKMALAGHVIQWRCGDEFLKHCRHLHPVQPAQNGA